MVEKKKYSKYSKNEPKQRNRKPHPDASQKHEQTAFFAELLFLHTANLAGTVSLHGDPRRRRSCRGFFGAFGDVNSTRPDYRDGGGGGREGGEGGLLPAVRTIEEVHEEFSFGRPWLSRQAQLALYRSSPKVAASVGRRNISWRQAQ